MGVSYKDAGVDIEKGDDFVDEIKKLGGSGGIGLFGAVFDVKALGMEDPLLISGTDGVGTKLKLAYKAKKHDTIGQDLVAMCANDVLCHGAKPLYFLDYLGTSKLNIETGKEIIKGIVEGCKLAGCELVGGETAEMPGIYKGEEYDLAGFCVGAVERRDLLPRTSEITQGDAVIALPSSGVHSNGFSLVNFILEKTETTNEELKELLTPTKIYVKEVHEILAEFRSKIPALANITGGGIYDNIMRVIPAGLDLSLDFELIRSKMPAVFSRIMQKGGVEWAEMQRVFNLGVGFVLIVKKEAADGVLKAAAGSFKIGEVCGKV